METFEVIKRLFPVWAVVVGLTAAVFICWLAIGPVAPAFTYSVVRDSTLDEGVGVMIVAPTGGNAWHSVVDEVVEGLGDRFPVEVAFGNPDPVTIHVAAERLKLKGAQRLVIVPLFISSHGREMRQMRSVLGLSSTPAPEAPFAQMFPLELPFVLADAMDADELIAEAVADTAAGSSRNRQAETLVIAVEQPPDLQDRVLGRQDLNKLAGMVQSSGGFKSVVPAFVSSYGPAGRDELRPVVMLASGRGRVTVVSLELGDGSLDQRVRRELKGLRYSFISREFLPRPKITQWIKDSIDRHLIKLHWERIAGDEVLLTT